ncbi:hypothetical protein JCM8097_005799 [Rhodosporidiobolus ruineniae]
MLVPQESPTPAHFPSSSDSTSSPSLVPTKSSSSPAHSSASSDPFSDIYVPVELRALVSTPPKLENAFNTESEMKGDAVANGVSGVTDKQDSGVRGYDDDAASRHDSLPSDSPLSPFLQHGQESQGTTTSQLQEETRAKLAQLNLDPEEKPSHPPQFPFATNFQYRPFNVTVPSTVSSPTAASVVSERPIAPLPTKRPFQHEGQEYREGVVSTFEGLSLIGKEKWGPDGKWLGGTRVTSSKGDERGDPSDVDEARMACATPRAASPSRYGYSDGYRWYDTEAELEQAQFVRSTNNASQDIDDSGFPHAHADPNGPPASNTRGSNPTPGFNDPVGQVAYLEHLESRLASKTRELEQLRLYGNEGEMLRNRIAQTEKALEDALLAKALAEGELEELKERTAAKVRRIEGKWETKYEEKCKELAAAEYRL